MLLMKATRMVLSRVSSDLDAYLLLSHISVCMRYPEIVVIFTFALMHASTSIFMATQLSLPSPHTDD